MQAQVIKPVDTCPTCQSQFIEMKSLYGMYKACPGDPGAQGLLQASVETYNQHHKDAHPVHPDAVMPGQVVAGGEPAEQTCDCPGCGKKHFNATTTIHIRSFGGDISYSACSDECSDKIVDDIYDKLAKRQKKASKAGVVGNANEINA